MSDIVQCATPIVKAKPFATAQLKLAKHSPEILLGMGIVGVVASTVLACRATLKAPAALEEAKEKFAGIEKARVADEEGLAVYSKKDRQEDLVKASVQTGIEFVKLYGVPVALMGLSIFSITKGHSITMKRNAALSSAFAALSAGYNEYRARVRERYGEEAERNVYYNLKEEVVEYTDEKGKKKKEKSLVLDSGEYPASIYARVFEPTNPVYGPSAEQNAMYLKCQQNYFNEILRIKKHVFLNEVYDALGFPRTPEGQAVGWLYDSSRGDGFIDFNLQELDFFEVNSDPYYKPIRFLLDFNVDGEIWNKI